MTCRILDVGDIAVVGSVFTVDGPFNDADAPGVLVSPDTAIAYVTRPDGVVLNSLDDPTLIKVTIGTVNVKALPDHLAHELGLTPGQNITGTGIVRIEFRVAINNEAASLAAGDWQVEVVGIGTADGTDAIEVMVATPRTNYRWTHGTAIA